MALTIHVILLFLTLRCGLTDTKECSRNQGPEIKWEKQLHTDLKKDYDFTKPPPSNKSHPFDVRVRFRLKSFNFISQEEILSMFSWMIITWTDDRLKWDPAKYNGLKTTEMGSLSVWSPMFKLFNAADVYDEDKLFYVECELNYKGRMLCVPRTTHETQCSVKLTNWPYDRQKCSIIYGPSNTLGCFKMSFANRAVFLLGAEYGAEWTIVDYEQIEYQSTDKQLEMIFTFEREAMTLASLLICPSYVLIALTLGTLWLDARDDLRLHLVCFSLFCHYYFISELGANIPKESIDTPTIILFYRGIEILTVINFLLTFSLRAICKKLTRPHREIASFNDVLYNNTIARFLIQPKWETKNERIEGLGEEDFITDWTKFANAINSLFIIIFIIVYMSLYFAFMPQPYSITPGHLI